MKVLRPVLAVLTIAAAIYAIQLMYAQAAYPGVKSEYGIFGYCEVDPERCWQGHGAEWWHWQYRKLERAARRVWQPTVAYAYRLAAALYRVSERALRLIGGCESGHRPWAQNPSSTAGGLMQYLDMTWRHTVLGLAGLSRFDPVAAALMAARWFATAGNWKPWAASRGCHGLR